MKQIFLGILASLVIIASLGFFKFKQIQAAMKNRPNFPPEAVTTTVAEKTVIEDSIKLVGTVVSETKHLVTFPFSGRLAFIQEDFAQVKKGEIIASLDHKIESARLANLVTKLDLAEKIYNKTDKLYAAKGVSELEYDTRKAEYFALKSEVRALREEIEQRIFRATEELRLGTRRFNVGEVVTAGTVVNTFQNVDEEPVLVFSIPHRYRAKLKSADIKVGGHLAELVGIDSQVDEYQLLQVKVKLLGADSPEAPLKEQQEWLVGQKLMVEVLFSMSETIAIPTSSISYSPLGNSVYVVGKDKTIEKREVTLGKAVKDTIIIQSGLQPGEEVVTTATFKLRPGIEVFVNNTSLNKDIPL